MIRKLLRMYTYQIKEVTYIKSRKKAIIKYGIAAVLLFTVVLTSFIPNFLDHHKPKRQSTRFSTDLKYILFWSPNKDLKYLEQSPGQRTFVNQECRIYNCFLSYNKSLLKNDMTNFDAVVFNIRDMANLNVRHLNFSRSERQIYIFHSLEPAKKHPLCSSKLDGFFNWTWTYKLNSDIPHPFFNIHNLQRQIIGPTMNSKWLEKLKHVRTNTEIINKKTKAIAWIVTQCEAEIKYKRHLKKFEQELASYNYTLDIYGACGHNSCPGKERFKCYKMIERDYFFSLVTEETLSEDWVTEKIVNSLNHVTIPVVIGGANYSNFLPPGSYIDAKSFPMKELGAIINYLIKNPDTYSFFFDWKNHYYYTPRSRFYLCDLCAHLNKDHEINTHKSYKSLRRWWNPDYKEVCNQLKKELIYNSLPDFDTVGSF